MFIGSSIIRRWKTLARDFPNHTIINRSFGGSQIADATRYADRIIIPCKPRLIVLGAGSNDLNAGKSPEQVAANFEAFVADRLHHNAAGYDVRVEIMRRHLGPAMKPDAAKSKSASSPPAGKQ